MFNVRDALSQIPSRPGFIIALIVALALGGWYLTTTWTQCSALRESRDELHAAILDAAASGAVLDLKKVFPGTWDEVRIARGYKLKENQRPLECPFGWDISRAERIGLIEKGQMTLIGLFAGGHFRRYVEWRSDWGRFAGDVKSIPAGAARFAVTHGADGAYVLSPVAQ
jgi:hypothetical protein